MHPGRVLYGTLCVRPFRTPAVQTVFEDPTGKTFKTAAIQSVLEDATGRAVLLAIYDKDARDFGAKYCKGKKIAIKEPLFKQNMDGTVGICVDFPANIEDMEENDSQVSGASTVTNDPTVIDEQANVDEADMGQTQVAKTGNSMDDPADTDTADFLRTEGNSCHARKDFRKAIDYYTQSIRCVELMSPEHAGRPFGATPAAGSKQMNQLLLAYSNRSEAWLQLESYKDALADSIKALDLNSGHEKTILRKGRSLHGLRRFDEAVSCLQGLLDLNTKPAATLRTNILATMKRAAHASKQANFGIYDDLDDYFRDGCNGFPPDCNDYWGPIEMRYVDGKRGRGLFLTKDVKEGELLLVSNALAVARLQGKPVTPAASRINTDKLSAILEDLITQLVELAAKSPSILHQLYSLQDSSDYPGGALPPKILFSGQGDMAEQEPGVLTLDVQRIRRIVGINALEGDFMWPSFGYKLDHKRVGLRSEENFLREEQHAAGLWALPSFINHSCCPNSSLTHIGPALFVHATRNLKKDTEITCAYHDIFRPLGTREDACALRGFCCLCPRCVLERTLAAKHTGFKKLAQSIGRYDQQSTATVEPPGSAAYFSQKFAGVSDSVEKTLIEHQHIAELDNVTMDWVRASYIIPYVFSAISLHAAGKPPGNLPLDSLFRIMFAVHPGCELTLSMFMENLLVAGASADALSMITRVCSCMYGNHKTEILQAILKWYRALWKTQFKPRT